MGSVHRTRLRGEKRSAERKEAVCDGAEAGVVVEASPCSPLEVVEPELLLHLLVVALDAPAQLGAADELFQRGADRERRQPELDRLGLSLRPCAEEPLELPRGLASAVPGGDADSHGGEPGGLASLGALAPGHPRVGVSAQSLGDLCDGAGCAVLVRSLPGRPQHHGALHADDVLEPAAGEAGPELADVAVARVGEHQVLSHAPAERVVNLLERDLPLLPETHRLRHADLLPPRQVTRPCLGQVDLQCDAAAPGLAGEVQARGDLAVVGAPERAGVLPGDPHRRLSLLREPGVVDDERFDPRQLDVQLERQPAAKLVVGPVTHRYALLEALPHRLDLGRGVNEPRRHRLDALALTVEQQPGDVQAHGTTPLLAAHAFHEGVHVLGELPLQLRDRLSIHRNGRSQPRISVKQVTRNAGWTRTRCLSVTRPFSTPGTSGTAPP